MDDLTAQMGVPSTKILPTSTPSDCFESRSSELRKDSRILIIGAGCFGLSTAYHLLQRGFENVTVLERSKTLPAPDAASNDINKIVRSSYSDIFYARLAREAISLWKNREIWGDSYDESGVLVLGLSGGNGQGYSDMSRNNDLSLGSRLKDLPDGRSMREVFPEGVHAGNFDQCAGYLNLDGGWADANQGLLHLMTQVEALNGKILGGKEVVSLRKQAECGEEPRTNSQITTLRCGDGTVIDADIVVIATGSWTPSTFSDLNINGRCEATGQSVAMIQLSDREAQAYRDCPVVLDFSSGFCAFPPNRQNIVKVAIHGPGYTHLDDNGTILKPRTSESNPESGCGIPREVLQDLRRHLRNVYPDLACKPFHATRLCWYNDTPDENWMIARHPSYSSIVFATGGSGHAYKFLPVIGRLVADLLENRLDIELQRKFAFDRQPVKEVHSRVGQAKRLEVGQLCTQEDLQNVELDA